MNQKNCLIIFTRKPELGKVKTRLATDIGNENALKVYNYLLSYSAGITKNVNAYKHVWYTSEIQNEDSWDSSIFQKHLQPDGDLGAKMKFAFDHAFQSNYENVIIIGSDLLDIDETLINQAFKLLNYNEVVIGPATDGGYYLLGLNEMIESIFLNKSWGSDDVFNETILDVKTKNIHILEYKNDIDYVQDLEQYPELIKLISE